jgi:hypothetical protein
MQPIATKEFIALKTRREAWQFSIDSSAFYPSCDYDNRQHVV